MEERLIAPWKQSKYLVGTSLMFLGPASYAYVNNMPFITTVLSVTSIVSANYWRHAKYSIRRDCDLIVAKFSMAIIFYNGAIYVKEINSIAVRIVIGGLITYSYYKSHLLYKRGIDKWLTYHMSFHLLITYEQFILITTIKDSDEKGMNSPRDSRLVIIFIMIYFMSFAIYFKYHSLS